MAIKFLAGINLEKNELQNPKIHNLASDPSGAVEGQMYYNTTDNQLKFYDGAWKVVSTSAGTMTSFTLTADSGTNQTVSNSNTVDIAGGSGISTVVGATDTVTVNLSNIANNTLLGNNSGSGAAPTALNATNIRTMLNVANGATANTGALADLDSVAAGQIDDDAISDEHLDVTAITGQTDLGDAFADGDTLLVYDLSATALKEGTVKNLANYMQDELTFTTNTFRTVTAGGNTLGASETLAFTAGSNITITESGGAVTIAGTANDDVSEANLKARLAGLDSADTLYIGDSGDDTEVVIRGNLTVDGTTTTVNSETVTIDDNIIELNSNAADTPTENAGIEVNRGNSTNVQLRWNESTDRWQFTNDGSAYNNIPEPGEYNNYSHPNNLAGDDFSIDTGALTGATVISDLDINISTNTNGHVTDANGTVSTRNLTLSDLGYTGATDANNYSLPTATASVLGGVKIGSRITISSGVISADVQTANDFTNTLKTKLDGIATGANNYSLPTATSSVLGGVKIGSGITITSGVISADTQSDENFTSALKTKLDGIATGANNYTLPSASTSATGGVELATDTEAKAGTDTSRAMTPANVKAAINDRSKVVILRGDGSTTAHSITHSLGTRDVIVQVVDYGNDGTGATYENVMVDVTRTSTSAVTVTFAVAPTTSEDYRVLIYKVV